MSSMKPMYDRHRKVKRRTTTVLGGWFTWGQVRYARSCRDKYMKLFED